MRKTIIIESKSAPIYHGTSIENVCGILTSNELRANISNETETYGVSFTRNRDSAYGKIRIKIDQEILGYNYKIKPIYRESIFGRDLAEERASKTITSIRKYILGLENNNPFTVKEVRRLLVDNFDDEDFWKRETMKTSSGHSVSNIVHYLDRMFSLSDKYKIPIDKELSQMKSYIQKFKNRVFDEEYSEVLKKKRARKVIEI